MFDTATDILLENRVVRYRLFDDSAEISYADVLQLWQRDEEFRDMFTSLLANSPFEGFRWETPALTMETANRPFEFVLINAPTFATRQSDRRTYSKYFVESEKENGIVCFPNLGKDATLIVPSPRGNDEIYGHLAAFVRGAPASQTHSLWSVLGRTVTRELSAKPVWINTAGGGVAWLHVRIDSRPKYYSHVPYKTARFEK
ncbi:MAG: hypothetical protein KDA84_25050 [Planctomycetaceae bacterium]|nr:hypothetical protein [Planctomycetaceae bacterium]